MLVTTFFADVPLQNFQMQVNYTRWLCFCHVPAFCDSLPHFDTTLIFGRTFLKSVFQTMRKQLLDKFKVKMSSRLGKFRSWWLDNNLLPRHRLWQFSRQNVFTSQNDAHMRVCSLIAGIYTTCTVTVCTIYASKYLGRKGQDAPREANTCPHSLSPFPHSSWGGDIQPRYLTTFTE